MSKNSQNFRSSSVQPNEKQSTSVLDLRNQKNFSYRNNFSSYSLNQSQQNLLLGINENQNDLSFYTSANFNCQGHHPNQRYPNNNPQIYINSSKPKLIIFILIILKKKNLG